MRKSPCWPFLFFWVTFDSEIINYYKCLGIITLNSEDSRQNLIELMFSLSILS